MSQVHHRLGRQRATVSRGLHSDTEEHRDSLYASDLLGQLVVSVTGVHLGNVCDILCTSSGSGSVILDAIVVAAWGASKHFPPSAFIDLRTTSALTVTEAHTTMHAVRSGSSVRHELLDRQIVDLEHECVVRINDVLFTASRPGEWLVHGVLVGAVGIGRRLVPRRLRSQRLLPHAHWGNLEQLPRLWPGGVDWVLRMRVAELPTDKVARIRMCLHLDRRARSLRPFAAVA